MTAVKNFFASRWGIVSAGVFVGVFAPLLQKWGNPGCDSDQEYLSSEWYFGNRRSCFYLESTLGTVQGRVYESAYCPY